ncbi:uncharacterized protein [Argopecten irradians]|uniref:uncharacterized protein isoform X2 n=1 Tax=Argopecten irradians TaxID=31199 RepID=UPI003711A121
MLISGRINAMHNTCEYHDFEFNAEVEIGSPFEKSMTQVNHSQRSMVSRDKAGSRADRKRNHSDSTSPNLDELTPWERELLKRRSNIIPKDGFIPNSVIRKNLGYVRPVTPTIQRKDIWTLKPVPEPDPRHMPPGWGGRPLEPEDTAMDIFEIARRYRLEHMESDYSQEEDVKDEDEIAEDKGVQLMPCMQNRNKVTKKKRSKKKSQGYESDESEEYEGYSQQRRVSLLPPEKDPKTAAPFTWADDDEARRSTLNPFQKLTAMVRASSTLSNASSIRGGYSKNSRRSTPVTPRYELKSKKLEFGSRNDLETPDSMRGVRKLTKSGGAQSRERSKSFKLTNMVVDEDSTNVRFKDQSGKRGSMLGNGDMDTIQKLLEEDWFADMRGTPSFDSIMQRLLTLLDTDDPELHAKICDYILDLHKDLGIPDMYLDRIVHKLSAQLGNSPGKSNNLQTLKQIGGTRPDVLATLLPRLIDSNSDVRDETANILSELVGVNNKDDLLQLMQDMGLKSQYNSKEEEEEALKALAMRLDIPYRSDSFNDWISNWVDESSSLYYEDAELKAGDISKNWDGRAVRVLPESLCITESSSRASNRLRELTNISDKSLRLEKAESVISDITFDDTTPSELESQLTDGVADENRGLLRDRGPVLMLDDNPFPLLDDPDLHRPSFIENLVQSYLEKQDTEIGIIGEISEDEEDKAMAEYEKSSKFKEQVQKRRSEGNMEKFMEGADQWTPELGRKQGSSMFDTNRESQDEIPPSATPRKSNNIRNSMSDEEEEEYDGFNPKDPAMYNYYKKRYPAYIRPGSGRKLHDKFGGVTSKRMGQFNMDGVIEPTDSGHHGDTADVAASISEVGEKVADTTLETMSTQDSGIGREISEVLSSKSGMETAVIKKGHHRSKQDWHKHSLSPVKSAGSLCPSGLSTPKGMDSDKVSEEVHVLPEPKRGRRKNWQRFFKTPTAQERRRMEMVKRDFDTGKVKQSNGQAVIQYIASDLPLLPGEAGLRLLHTVRVGNKGPTIGYDGRHRVEPIPGKLMVQTKNEDTGKSNFGILQMQWTTGVPVATSHDNYLQHRQMASGQSERSPSECTRSCDTMTEKSYISAQSLPNLQSVKQSKKKKKHVKKETKFILPRLYSRTTAHSHDYQWERPLPPPPAHKSSSQSSEVRRQHENYCKYYDLTKKKMQQYTSSNTKDLLLPEVVIRNALGASPKLHKSLTKLSRGHSVLLPPITLNQLMRVAPT